MKLCSPDVTTVDWFVVYVPKLTRIDSPGRFITITNLTLHTLPATASDTYTGVGLYLCLIIRFNITCSHIKTYDPISCLACGKDFSTRYKLLEPGNF